MPRFNFYQKYQYFHGAGCEQFLTYDMNCYSPLRGSIDIFGRKTARAIVTIPWTKFFLGYNRNIPAILKSILRE